MIRPFGWWVSFLVFVTTVGVALAVIVANGLQASWPILSVTAAPFAAYVVASNRMLPGVRTILLVLSAATFANIIVSVHSPLSAPFLETCVYAFSSSVCILAGGVLACKWLSPIAPRPSLLGLFGMLAIGLYFLVATLSAPTAWVGGLYAFLLGAILCGVPLFILVTLGAKAHTGWKRFVYYTLATLIAIGTFVVTIGLFFNYYAMLSKLQVSRYQLTLDFNDNEQNFVANEWLQAEFDWRDDDDLVRNAEGAIAGWDQQISMHETLEMVSLSDFHIVDMDIREYTPDSNAPYTDGVVDRFRVVLSMERSSIIPSQQDGLLFQTAQFRLPTALGLTPAVMAEPPDLLQIQVNTSENFGLEHNVAGTAVRVIDPEGRASLQIYGQAVEDVWGTLRLRYPIKPLRAAYLSDVAYLAGNRLVHAGVAIGLGGLLLWTAILAGRRWARRQTGPRIFINYRRGDEPGFAQALFQYLERTLPTAEVFMDVSGGLQPGDDFSEVLRVSVDDCDVLLAVIGPAWADARNEDGSRRLEDGNDWVRREIATALEREKLVVPILVGGARIPKRGDLPEVLRSLSGKQAVELRTLTFKVDAHQLVQFLSGYRTRTKVRPASRRPLIAPS